MKLNAAIKNMTTKIADVLSLNDPSVYIYGSYVLDDFQYGWSDIDILVLTQKSISEQQANELVCLRQSITAAESDNPFYRCFEGGMLTLNAFIRKVPDRVVYWGTSGQRITDSYHFDACCMKELLDYSRLLHGKDIRGQLTPPSFEDIKTNIQFHYDTIRKYASSTGRSIYSFGWLLDIARCIYTLRTGKIISKTAAGEWALQNCLFHNITALETALEVRKNPQKYLESAELQALSGKLGNAIQQYADVLEKELKTTSFVGVCILYQSRSLFSNKKTVSSTVFLFGLHHFSRPSRIGTDVLLCKTEK